MKNKGKIEVQMNFRIKKGVNKRLVCGLWFVVCIGEGRVARERSVDHIGDEEEKESE